MLLKVDQLGVAPGRHLLIKDISMTLNAGEVLVVLGQNGAGKSTLFKALSGEWKPSCGSIELLGRELEQWPAAQLACRRAVLPQYSSLAFDFTVQEVVAMGRMPHSTGRAVDALLVERVMRECDVFNLRKRLYTSLSGGERQRTQLARVLVQIAQDPPGQERLLLLDEPTSALDLAHQHSLLQQIRMLAGQQVGVLMILHDLNLAAAYADRIMLLKQGQCVSTGGVEEVMQAALLSEVFELPLRVLRHPDTGKPHVIASY